MSDWIDGPIPGPSGPVEVLKFPREDMKPWSRLIQHPPDLCLHTTEGSTVLGDAYKRWEFPPNFACGDGHIVQLFPLGYASEAVDSKDGYLVQVELAFRVGAFSATKVYLPPASTLDPLVALTAFLHQRGFIRDGLHRPNPNWPTQLDRLPAATDRYYRRSDGTWGKPGVYGHVEIPDDEHYDPASFDYPRFFEMVRGVLEGDDMRLEDYYDGWDRYKDARKAQGADPGPAPDSMENADRRKGWNHARDAFQNPKTAASGVLAATADVITVTVTITAACVVALAVFWLKYRRSK